VKGARGVWSLGGVFGGRGSGGWGLCECGPDGGRGFGRRGGGGEGFGSVWGCEVESGVVAEVGMVGVGFWVSGGGGRGVRWVGFDG